MTRPELGATYARLFMGLSDGSNLGQQSLAYAQPVHFGGDGTMGVAWQNFGLDSLYSERTISLSYGRLGWKTAMGRIYWGLTVKQLHRSFGSAPESSNAWDGAAYTGQPDFVLSNPTGGSAIDADGGLLWRAPRHFSVGLSISHLNSPDVSFGSEPDPVPMLTRLGASYHSLWMNLALEARVQESPLGGKDTRMTAALERTFPTLESGE